MNVGDRDIELLLQLQECDKGIMKAKRQREELPQRMRMATVKKKQAEFQEKADQVAALIEKTQEELRKVEVEDESLADKQKRAQELIDAAGSDFRSVESHSKEMGGFTKRRETLSEKHDDLNARLSQAHAIKDKIDGGLKRLEGEAEAVRASFAEDDGKLAEQLRSIEEKRAGIADQLDSEVLKIYEKTALRTGGVAIGRLEEDMCGVCRSAIEGGRLIELKASAPLSVCPYCKRLLVVE